MYVRFNWDDEVLVLRVCSGQGSVASLAGAGTIKVSTVAYNRFIHKYHAQT